MVEFLYESQKPQLTCTLDGDFKSAECTALADAINAQLAPLSGADGKLPANFRVVLEMTKVDYVSSLFLRIVLMLAKKVRRGNLSLANPNQSVKDVIQTSGLEQLLTIDSSAAIESAHRASPSFPPPADFARQSRLSSLADYERLYRQSIDNPEQFWGEQAREHLVWSTPWRQVRDWKLPDARWFDGGKLNASANCLDRHLDTPVADKVALLWEGEPVDGTGTPEVRRITYRELHREVCRCANVLKAQGLAKGDRVIIYMPMVPEAVVAMLACARVGAAHSVVFGGFSAQAVADRVSDSGAKLVITTDGSFRRGAVVPLKTNVDDAFALNAADGRPLCATIQRVLVLKRAGNPVTMTPGRDLWWHEEMAKAANDCPAEPMDSDDTLFILYTSGSTGKPKGIFHRTAGYLLDVKLTHSYVFDIKPSDVYWCTADIGWITGHSYIVYGPLANGTTVLMYEGAPNFPDKDRFWSIIARHKVTIFYTAPTAIRAFMQWGDAYPRQHDLSSLRLLGSVGEPINPHAWLWYHEFIGGKRCPIVDTWWQTETGAIMISTLPGAMTAKPGAAGRPMFGVVPEVVDDQGNAVPADTGGKLVIRQPWPAMLRGIWGDPQRYEWTYWKDVPGSYFTGDGARQDKDGYLWIVGRIDDVLNVSGHRIGTAEVESALVSHRAVAEAAVVGRPDDIKGSALVVFVTLRSGFTVKPGLVDELRQHVGNEVGPVAKPDEIRFVQALPKTRSGKIMRRLLKQVAAGTDITGDTTTLEDFNVLSKLTGDEG